MWKCPMVWVPAVLMVVAGGAALGAPVDFKEVPADAKWVAHFDGEASRASKVMQAFLKECLGKDLPAEAGDLAHGSPWAAAVLEKIDGVTLYGSQIGLRNGAAIVRGKCDKEALMGKLRKAGAKVSTMYSREIAVWTVGKDTKAEREVALSFPKEGVMVFAAGTKQLH